MKVRKLNIHKSYLFFLMHACALLVIVSTGCTGSDIEPASYSAQHQAAAADAVNINTADVSELERIPHIGPALAARIVEHRTRYGPFRKAEHLIAIDGISDSRFRKIRHLIRAE